MKKRYAGGLKLFAAVILAVSLLLVSFFGAVTVYGLTIGALPGGMPRKRIMYTCWR